MAFVVFFARNEPISVARFQVRYLQGYDLEGAARLIALPHAFEPKPDLVAILAFLDRLVEQARDSVLEGKVNAFDQQRINSFFYLGSRTSKASDRLLAYKLKEVSSVG
ncbi:hypothetical protein DL98DRAFT_540096 [Cadophora sp. DSE1049]|nr:hypothetical protein DL98DRAFT_540096 [Cadophora sp. DSE1049]